MFLQEAATVKLFPLIFCEPRHMANIGNNYYDIIIKACTMYVATRFLPKAKNGTTYVATF